MVNSPVFTAIVCTYNRPAMLKEAVAAIGRQTYKNLEIILINNGTDSESIDYLEEVAGIDKRVKLVHFKDNVYSPDDPGKYIDICFNAALEIATGDYIWCQSDDDFIGDDYAERMIALFLDNPECTTAAGFAVSIDGEGKPNGIAHDHPNVRPRYMPGHEMALASALGKSTLFGAPGCIFTVKRDALINAGGFRQPLEYCHLFGLVPFGITGFDDTAKLYWRHHEGQLNKEATSRGLIGVNETFSLFNDWEIGRRWEVFGMETAGKLVTAIEREQCLKAARWMTSYLYSWNFSAALYVIRSTWNHPNFWCWTAVKVAKRAIYIKPIRAIWRSLIRLVFRLVPMLSRLSSGLASIRERVNR